jgi:hypothetical protein
MRNYNPQIGRWNQIDPLTKEQISPYQSFSNNPCNFVDPMGASEGWVKDLETGFVVDDPSVNTPEEFENSDYDKERYTYKGNEPIVLDDGTSVSSYYELSGVEIFADRVEKSNLSINMDNALYGFQHSWDGAAKYMNTEDPGKYGPFSPEAIGISIPIKILPVGGYVGSVSIVMGPDGPQLYSSGGTGFGNDISLGVSFDAYAIKNPKNWRDELTGTSRYAEIGSWGLSAATGQNYDYSTGEYGGNVKSYSLSLSAGTDQLPVGMVNASVYELHTFRIDMPWQKK